MSDDDFQIIEDSGGGGFGNKNATSFQEILMMQLSRCAKIGSQEMKKGYWKTIPINYGGTSTGSQKIWMSDTRKEYISAIQTLYDLLLARFDDEMHNQSKEINSKIKERKKKYAKDGIPETKFIDFELLMYRKTFQKLNLLIGRLGYFVEGEGIA